MTSWAMRRAYLRPGRTKAKTDDEGEFLDLSKEPVYLIKDILMGLNNRNNEATVKYIKAFIKLGTHINGSFNSLGYNSLEILTCLRVPLVSISTQIRSGSIRAIRYVLQNEEDVMCFNKLQMPFLLARSLDLVLKNDAERLESMKLIRKVLLLSSSNFSMALARSLVSLANGGIEEKDRLLRISLATLCELGVLNAPLFIECGGVAAVTRNLLECQTPKIAESLCGVLLFLLDKPCTRNVAAVDLSSVAAAYSDFHYKPSWKDKNWDGRDLRFTCSRLAMLSILRSWPGLLHFCNPRNTSGLKAVIDILYLNQLEVRKAVLDLLYELLGLPQPEWTDELSVALRAVDPCEPQTSWRLNEGFVVSEGRSVLPHLAKTTPKITDMHLAILLNCFYNNRLIDALVEVIATSDTFISVRATVLLGELLHLIQIMLPPECCNTSPALPTLLEYATKNAPLALGAVTALLQFHKLQKKKLTSYSLYLDYILKSGSNLKLATKKNKLINRYKNKSIKSKIHQFVVNNGDDIIKETGVLTPHSDPYQWNWNLIRIIVKGESGLKVVMAESTHRTFLKRLVDFYLPSNNKYSHMDLSATKTCLAYTMVGIELIQFLMDLNDLEAARFLGDLFKDILDHIIAITSGRSVHDCLFSPQHMVNTQGQSYFLFVGRLATQETGINLLNQINMFQHLKHLATTTNNDCYVKLIISSMDYSIMSPCRHLLAAVLKCNIESSRLYATQFLLILLRSGVPNFDTWGIQLLANQLTDKSKAVSLSALTTLHEACEITECLETIIKTPIDFNSLGEKGHFLLARLLSHPKGFTKFNKEHDLTKEVKKWDDYLMFRYVKQVEDEISDMLTLHQRGEDGKYDQRVSAIKSNNRRDLHLPSHLYGQLSQHDEGYKFLLEHGSIGPLLRVLVQANCDNNDNILKLKAALWAVSQFATSYHGIQFLLLEDIISKIVDLAENCLVLSIRAVAYYALGLVGTTPRGADELYKLGWVCVRHNRHELWPIIQEEDAYKDSGSENESEDSFLEVSLTDSPTLYHIPDSHKFSTPERYSSFKNKSSTLPINQNYSSTFHQRSMSESKTFEMLKGYELKLRERVGLPVHSFESTTTSSISSYDSGRGGKTLTSYIQPLSPIPSSSNLNAIRKHERKVRRHSETCRRDSENSSSSDKKSSLQGSQQRLSSQDLVGYTTMHCLRRYNVKSDDEENPKSRIPKSFLNINGADSRGLSVEHFICSSSLSSLASVKKFLTDERSKQGGPTYLGVCLPQQLANIFFIKDNLPSTNHIALKTSDTELQSYQFNLLSLTSKDEPNFKHIAEDCIECCLPRESSISDDQCNSGNEKQQLLKHIELLSNPLWYKTSKLALLQHKQSNPQIFEDPCLYSDVCKMLSENYFRLSIRRILHELFYEVYYCNLFNNATHVLSSKDIFDNDTKSNSFENKLPKRTNSLKESSTDAEVSGILNASLPSYKNQTQVSGLKLTYKENKFPIKNKQM